MRLRSPNRVLRNINTEWRKKTGRCAIFCMGTFRVWELLNQGYLFVAIIALTALRFQWKIQFQRNVDHTSFPPLWAGCHLKWWRCVCGKTVKVFWRWKHPPMSMWVISHVWQTAGISSCSSESYANPLMWLLIHTHTHNSSVTLGCLSFALLLCSLGNSYLLSWTFIITTCLA